ncbi:uncharacterized protein LOC144478071 [Augochlora pura]
MGIVRFSQLCDCPPKPPPKTLGQRLCGTLLFLLKSSIAAGLVYWTHAEGLWGSSEEVEDLYHRILATIAPTVTDEQICTEDVQTRVELFKQNVVQNYNRALYSTMRCIAGASSMLREQLQRVLPKQEENPEGASSDDS